MKERFLKFLYLRYTTYFYRFLTEEFLGDIPESVKEPSMRFLSQGRVKLEKWALYQSHFLQSRMVMDVDKIKTYEGMMLMLKLLMVHTKQPAPITTVIGEAEPEKVDAVKSVEDGIAKFKREAKEKSEKQ